jgi:hypothetical protein
MFCCSCSISTCSRQGVGNVIVFWFDTLQQICSRWPTRRQDAAFFHRCQAHSIHKQSLNFRLYFAALSAKRYGLMAIPQFQLRTPCDCCCLQKCAWKSTEFTPRHSCSLTLACFFSLHAYCRSLSLSSKLRTLACSSHREILSIGCPAVFSGALSRSTLSEPRLTSAPPDFFRFSRHNRKRVELHCIATDGYNSGR